MKQTASETVLLIRVNSSTELLNTSQSVNLVRRRFPNARLLTLATPQTETRTLLETDPRFDRILLFPDGAERPEKSPSAFRRFMARQRIGATVVCFGATPGFDYSRHLLSALLCPGRRYFLDATGQLYCAESPRGAGLLLGAALALGKQRALLPLLRRFARQKLQHTRGLPQDIRRILVIRLDHIGDVALSLPAIHALKKQFPDAQIDACVGSATAPLMTNVAEVSDVIVCDAPRFSRDGRRQSLAERWALVRRLRRSRYDLAIDLRGDDASRLWALASGATRRAGPDSGPYELPQANLSFLLTHPVSQDSQNLEGEHAVEIGLRLIKRLGVCIPGTAFQFAISPGREQTVARKRAEQHIPDAYAVLHIQPGDPAKKWATASFAAVAEHLIKRHGLEVVLSGAPADWEINAQVQSQVQSERVHNAAGVFTLEELPALFAKARLLVTVDTGPMHIAAAAGTPIVAVFLPWSVATFHPYGQAAGVVVPDADDLRGLEKSGRLWEGSLLEAVSPTKVCAAIDRKMVATYV